MQNRRRRELLAWRPMTAADLPAVRAVAAVVHPDHPEDAAVFAERRRLHPAGCFVLAQGPRVVGYVLSHPWIAHETPALNTRLGGLPRTATTYYLHDLAVLPEARRSGAGTAIVARLIAHARGCRLTNLSLIAIAGSEGFWRRHGFAEVAAPDLAASLASYGAGARPMIRAV